MMPSASLPQADPAEMPKAAPVESARAKVNLTLHVKGRAPDGYHELESLVVFADVADELTFTPSSKDSLDLEGPFAGLVDGENLVMKAKRAVASWLGVEISGAFPPAKEHSRCGRAWRRVLGRGRGHQGASEGPWRGCRRSLHLSDPPHRRGCPRLPSQ